MTSIGESAYCRSHKHFLEICIDGNACKENAADERWVGITVSGYRFDLSKDITFIDPIICKLLLIICSFLIQVLREAPNPSLSGKQLVLRVHGSKMNEA